VADDVAGDGEADDQFFVVGPWGVDLGGAGIDEEDALNLFADLEDGFALFYDKSRFFYGDELFPLRDAVLAEETVVETTRYF